MTADDRLVTRVSRPLTSLWHVRESVLADGEVIPPDRWGAIVTAQGQSHRFFYREQLLELYRISHTSVPISRLACSFAFEDRAVAMDWADEGDQFVHRVEPAHADGTGVRVDMLWLTWMGESGSTFSMNVSRCRAYWAGESTRDASPSATPTWEWLFAGGLRVISSQPDSAAFRRLWLPPEECVFIDDADRKGSACITHGPRILWHDRRDAMRVLLQGDGVEAGTAA